MRKHAVFISLLLMIFFIGATVWAEDNLSLSIDVKKEIKVKKADKWIIETVPADNTLNGDVLRYTIAYKNEGKELIKNASVIGPIPKETVYILESATGKETQISYSIDGGNLYLGPPVTYVVKKPDGTEEKKPAPAAMYTHIKWKILSTIAPGKSGQVSFKVIVK